MALSELNTTWASVFWAVKWDYHCLLGPPTPCTAVGEGQAAVQRLRVITSRLTRGPHLLLQRKGWESKPAGKWARIWYAGQRSVDSTSLSSPHCALPNSPCLGCELLLSVTSFTTYQPVGSCCVQSWGGEDGLIGDNVGRVPLETASRTTGWGWGVDRVHGGPGTLKRELVILHKQLANRKPYLKVTWTRGFFCSLQESPMAQASFLLQRTQLVLSDTFTFLSPNNE